MTYNGSFIMVPAFLFMALQCRVVLEKIVVLTMYVCIITTKDNVCMLVICSIIYCSKYYDKT